MDFDGFIVTIDEFMRKYNDKVQEALDGCILKDEEYYFPEFLIPFAADIIGNNPVTYAKIDSIYDKDVVTYYKNTVKSPYYKEDFITNKSLRREIYTRKALGILATKNSVPEIREIMAKGWKQLYREIANSNARQVSLLELDSSYSNMDNEKDVTGLAIIIIAWLEQCFIVEADDKLWDRMYLDHFRRNDVFMATESRKKLLKSVKGTWDEKFVENHRAKMRELYAVSDTRELFDYFLWRDGDDDYEDFTKQIENFSVEMQTKKMVEGLSSLGYEIDDKMMETGKNIIRQNQIKVKEKDKGRKLDLSVKNTNLRTAHFNSEEYGDACAIVRAMAELLRMTGLDYEMLSEIKFDKYIKENILIVLNYSFCEMKAGEFASLLFVYALGEAYRKAKADSYDLSMNQRVESTEQIENHLKVVEEENSHLKSELATFKSFEREINNNTKNEKQLRADLSSSENENRRLKSENIQLKKEIEKQQAEFENYLKIAEKEETDSAPDFNMDICIKECRVKKVIVFAGHDSWQDAIRQVFPEWKYISADMLHFDEKMLNNYDYIIYNTRVTSHSLYRKVCSYKNADSAMILVNGSNLEQSLETIWKGIKDTVG